MSRTRGHDRKAHYGLRGKELWSSRPGIQCAPAKKLYRKFTARIERRRESKMLRDEANQEEL